MYEFPFLAHATMEPMNCVAWLHDGMLETWSGHQFPTFDHMFAAKAAGLPMDKVKLHTLVSGGSFGRRANVWSDFTVAAVNVAKAIGGRAPVRLQFSREDDTGAGLYRPMYVHAVKAGARRAGPHRTVAAHHRRPVDHGRRTDGRMMIKDGIDPTSVEGVDKSVYDLPMLAGTLHSPTLAVRPLWWRSVGSTHTAYVMETMIDELAAAAGRDPVAFRLALLGKSPRAAAVLKLAADKAGWGKSRRAGVAQGIAVHESFDTFVAQVAEVSMRNGKVKVERVVCAVDCGVPVNPDVIRAQMEGCIGFALGALYYSEIELKAGRAVQRNFDTYRSLRIHEMPKVEVHIVPEHRKADRRRRAGRASAGTGRGQCRRQTGRAARAPPAVHAGGAGRDLTRATSAVSSPVQTAVKLLPARSARDRRRRIGDGRRAGRGELDALCAVRTRSLPPRRRSPCSTR